MADASQGSKRKLRIINLAEVLQIIRFTCIPGHVLAETAADLASAADLLDALAAAVRIEAKQFVLIAGDQLEESCVVGDAYKVAWAKVQVLADQLKGGAR